MGGGNDTQASPTVSKDTQDDSVEPTAPSDSTDNTDRDVVVSADFPMTGAAFHITEVGDGSLL
jgi:hypothetical protein